MNTRTHEHAILWVFKTIVLILIMLNTGMKLFAQAKEQSHIDRILFVLDCSNSMITKWEHNTKIWVAKNTLSQVVDSLKYDNNIEFALRVYGHQSEGKEDDCEDTRLEVPFSKSNEMQIIEKLGEIKPKGTTLIAYSLQATENDFPRELNSNNAIILITDGLESCAGDPCAVSLALQRNNVILKLYVIGINLEEEKIKGLDCIGETFNAMNEQQFNEILWDLINRITKRTTAQVDLLDSYNNPTETNVNMTFYDAKSGDFRHNFYHTMNVKGTPDMLFLNPSIQYNIIVHTNPPVVKNNVDIVVNRHNEIPIPSPQGNLVVKFTGNVTHDDKVQYIVRKTGSSEIIDVKGINVETKYIVGKYDLEILTLPRIILTGIDISQIKTTTISFPVPGKVNISSRYSGFGGVFTWDKNELIKIFNFRDKTIHETLALLPGDYKIIFRDKMSKQTIKTIEKNFTIESNKNINVRID